MPPNYEKKKRNEENSLIEVNKYANFKKEDDVSTMSSNGKNFLLKTGIYWRWFIYESCNIE